MIARRLALAVTVAVAAIAAGSAHASTNLVANGSFEGINGSDPVTLGDKYGFNTGVSVNDWLGGGGLSFVDGPGTADNPTYLPVYGPFPATSPDGGNFVESDGNIGFRTSMYQTINDLTVGEVYNLTFYQAAGQQTGFFGNTTSQWQVTFGDTEDCTPGTNCSEQASPILHVASGGVVGWSSVSLNFVAHSTSEVLTFMALSDRGNTVNLPPIAFVDGIDLTDTGTRNTPEPLTLSLLGVGLAGLGIVRYRSRAKRG